MVDKEKLAKMIQDEIKRVGLRKLARALSLAPTSLYNYTFQNVTPSTVTLEKIAKYFNLHPTDLYKVDVPDALPDGLDPDESQWLKLRRQLVSLSVGRLDKVMDYLEYQLQEARKEAEVTKSGNTPDSRGRKY